MHSGLFADETNWLDSIVSDRLALDVGQQSLPDRIQAHPFNVFRCKQALIIFCFTLKRLAQKAPSHNGSSRCNRLAAMRNFLPMIRSLILAPAAWSCSRWS